MATLLWLVNSAPYETAKQFVYSSPKVIEKVGVVKSTRLTWRGGAINYRGGVSSAHFYMVASGETSAACVYVELEKRDDTWTVQGGKLLTGNGSEISLTP